MYFAVQGVQQEQKPMSDLKAIQMLQDVGNLGSQHLRIIFFHSKTSDSPVADYP